MLLIEDVARATAALSVRLATPRAAVRRRQSDAYVLLRYSKYKDLRDSVFADISGQHSLRPILSALQLATRAIENMEWNSGIRRRPQALG